MIDLHIEYWFWLTLLVVAYYNFPLIKTSSWLRNTWIFCFLIHLGVTLLFALVSPDGFGNIADANSMHGYATNKMLEQPTPLMDGFFYRVSLAELYRLFQPSFVVAGLYSLAMYTVFSLLLLRIGRRLLNDRCLALLLLVSSLSPFFLIYTSALMSESLQTVMFALVVVFWFEAFADCSLKKALTAIWVTFLLGFGHKGLVYYAPLVSLTLPPIFCLYYLWKKRHPALVVTPVLTVLLATGFSLILTGISNPKLPSGLLDTSSDKPILGRLLPHFSNGFDPRNSTKYLTKSINSADRQPNVDQTYLQFDELRVLTTQSLMVNWGVRYYLYQTQPSINYIQKPIDVMAYSQKWLRLIALFIGLVGVFCFSQQSRVVVYLGLYFYMTFSLMMSLGTFFVAQSLRHHSVTDWLLYLMAFSFFVQPVLEHCKSKPKSTTRHQLSSFNTTTRLCGIA